MGRAIGFLLILLVGMVLGWLLTVSGTLGMLGLPGPGNLPPASVSDNNVTTSTTNYRFVLENDRILYQNATIDLTRFQALINEARQQDAVVILEYDATVTGKFVEDLMKILNEAGVKFVGIG